MPFHPPKHAPSEPPLRFVTWLAPSLPYALFEAVAEACGDLLGRAVSLESVVDVSGPAPEREPFRSAAADVGFLCPPTYRRMRERALPVELLAAPVFADPRTAGRPVYFSEVVVRASSSARALEALRGGTFAYNDPASLSGWECLPRALARRGETLAFFSRYRCSGSHLASLDLVARGEADVAAVDSNVLALALARDPRLRRALRVVETWGPWPAQPAVVRSGLSGESRRALRAALLSAHEHPRAAPVLSAFRLERFVPARECDYLELGHRLAAGDPVRAA